MLMESHALFSISRKSSQNTLNLAPFWAALIAVYRHNRSESRKIDSLACPGLGTGTGGMDALEAALQVCLAYEHYQRPPQFLNPSVAQQRHERVYYGGHWGFTQPRKTVT